MSLFYKIIRNCPETKYNTFFQYTVILLKKKQNINTYNFETYFGSVGRCVVYIYTLRYNFLKLSI